MNAQPALKPTLDALAKEAWSNAETVKDAAAALFGMLDADASAKAAYRGCEAAVRACMTSDRSKVYHLPRGDVQGQARRTIQLARGTADGLMDFPLHNGTVLRDATREDLAECAEKYMTQGKTLMQRGIWLRLVAQSVPDGQTAGEALTDARLAELQSEAECG